MLVLLVAVATFAGVFSAKSPVLIWSSSRPLSDLPQSYAGETLSGETFSEAYLKPLTSNAAHSLVVFMQDKLSVEDFTNHADVYNPSSDGGAFQNVKLAIDNHFSVHLPAVSDTKATIESVSTSFPGEVIKVDNPEEFAKLKLEDGKSYFILVALHPIQLQEEYNSFKKNDEVIGNCLHHLNKRGVKYSAIYTAESSSKEEEVSHQGRHLLETAEQVSNGTFVTQNGLMLFLNNISVTVTLTDSQGKVTSLASTYLFENGSQADIKRDNDTISLKLTFSGNGTAEIFMLIKPNDEFEFVDTNGTFSWNPGVVQYEVDDMPMDYMIQATKGFCFHCSALRAQPVLRELNATDIKQRQVRLILHSLQIQAFNPWDNSSMRFSNDVWDCVEFFTVPIWMGIFTTVLLLIILFFGVTMIANITTMDRFDDPKGKTISVVVNE